MNIRFSFILFYLLAICSCDKSHELNPAKSLGIEVNEKMVLEEGQIDGTLWTLAELSDSLDGGITRNQIHQLFGASAQATEQPDGLILLYEIVTPENHIHGVRMTHLELRLMNEKLIDARIGFTSYGE